jgi:predicted house-cleaning noncanonical NTP pyrophosphatase (MazG superfamily)
MVACIPQIYNYPITEENKKAGMELIKHLSTANGYSHKILGDRLYKKKNRGRLRRTSKVNQRRNG